MGKVKKSLAMKLLEGKKIGYELVIYPDGMGDAEQIAHYLGVGGQQLFKSLVVVQPEPRVRGMKSILAVIPANRQLNLKKVAELTGNKKLKMGKHEEAERLTGLQVGGISPLLLINKGFEFWLDIRAQEEGSIYISAGERGKNLLVAVSDLIQLVGMEIGDLSD